MFLTSGQRQYYNTIKKLGNKKPQKTIKRPKVNRFIFVIQIPGIFFVRLVFPYRMRMFLIICFRYINNLSSVFHKLKIL